MPFCRLSRRARVRSAAMVRPRRVVDVERKALQLGSGPRQLAEFLLADLAHAQILGADARLLGEDTSRQLIGRHFEAEQGDRRAGRLLRLDPVFAVLEEALRGGEGDVGAERALAHAGTAGDDDQVGFVKAADLGVEAVESGGEARTDGRRC